MFHRLDFRMSIYSFDHASVAYRWLSIDTSFDINISCDL